MNVHAGQPVRDLQLWYLQGQCQRSERFPPRPCLCSSWDEDARWTTPRCQKSEKNKEKKRLISIIRFHTFQLKSNPFASQIKHWLDIKKVGGLWWMNKEKLINKQKREKKQMIVRRNFPKEKHTMKASYISWIIKMCDDHYSKKKRRRESKLDDMRRTRIISNTVLRGTSVNSLSHPSMSA